RGTHPGCNGGTRCCSSDVLLFQVVLVTLLGQRDRLAVPSLLVTSLISGYQQHRVPPGIEDIQDADSLRPAEPGCSSFRLVRRECWMRSASGRLSSGPASSSMPMAWPTWIALARSCLRKSCSHARTSDAMTRA